MFGQEVWPYDFFTPDGGQKVLLVSPFSSLSVCLYVCMYVCTYVRTYVCMYIYIHVYNLTRYIWVGQYLIVQMDVLLVGLMIIIVIQLVILQIVIGMEGIVLMLHILVLWEEEAIHGLNQNLVMIIVIVVCIYLLIQSIYHPSIRPSIIHPSIHSSSIHHPFIHLSIDSSIHPFIQVV